mmetsp:Transcript_11989/g.39419  ORF Transcript_11989/g.39419 Transcript_11989/m.39419 type:complete len:205 (-) Transcript_11989:420-1034(-)
MPVSWHVAPAFLNCGGARVGRGRGARQLLYGHWGAERARVCSRGRPWGAASRRGERRARAKARRAEEGLRRREWRPPLSARRAAENLPRRPARGEPPLLPCTGPLHRPTGLALPLHSFCSARSTRSAGSALLAVRHHPLLSVVARGRLLVGGVHRAGDLVCRHRERVRVGVAGGGLCALGEGAAPEGGGAPGRPLERGGLQRRG